MTRWAAPIRSNGRTSPQTNCSRARTSCCSLSREPSPPACSDSHLPGYEQRYDDFRAAGIDAVYCLAVNDAFVIFQWAKSRDIQNVVMVPDGNGEFTRLMGMLVQRTRQGMGLRSW